MRKRSVVLKDDGLVQMTIFNALQNWKDSSMKQESDKKYKKMGKSVIEVESCDELPEKEIFKKRTTVKRQLAFSLSDSEDDEYRKSLRENPSPKKMAKIFDVNKPQFSSTPLNSNKDKYRNVNIPDISSQTSVAIGAVNSAVDSDSDTTIIEDGKNPNVSSVTVIQHIIITPKKNENDTSIDITNNSSKANEQSIKDSRKTPECCNTTTKKIKTKSGISVVNGQDKGNIFTSNSVPGKSSINMISSTIEKSPSKGTATPPAINRTPTNNKSPVFNRTPTKSKSPKASASPVKSPKKLKKSINKNYLRLITELFSSVYKSPYSKSIIKDETKLLKEFFSTKPEYQYVCLKLATWKSRWYNRHKFCEKINIDMSDREVAEMYNFLAEKGIIETDYSRELLVDLLPLLHNTDIRSVCDKFKLNKTVKKKEDMIQLILKYTRTQSTLNFTKSLKDLIFEEVKKKMGLCFKLKETFKDAFEKAYILGTFPNPDFDDIMDFFKTMLDSRIEFPEFDVENYVVFYSRGEFVRYVEARKYRDDLHRAKALQNHVEMLRTAKEIFKKVVELANQPEDDDRYTNAPHLKKFSAKSVYISTLSKFIKYLRAKFPKDVKEWLEFLIENVESPHRIGDWYYDLTWLYMRYLKPISYEYAAELLMKVLKENSSTLSERQIYFLGERGEQLKNSKTYKINQLYHDRIAELLPEPIDVEVFPRTVVDAKAIRSHNLGKKRKYVVQDSEGNKTFMSVEKIALDFYTENCGYSDGRHCEGSLLKALFTLCFWDIIYNPETVVPGTFLTKLQNVPLDMFSPYFYQNRKQAIDKRLKDIESDWTDDEIIKFAKNNWDLHSHESGFCEAGVYIEDTIILENLISCLDRKILSKIFERIVKNVLHNRSGLPDLLIWNIDSKKSKFVEVKGEGDKLSLAQKLWLKYLLSIGANAEICHVHSIGSKRKYVKKVDTQHDASCSSETNNKKDTT